MRRLSRSRLPCPTARRSISTGRIIRRDTSTSALRRSTLCIFAAGMATKGYRPFCAIYSTFLQRAFDPIVHDVCLQNLPVMFCMDRGGLSGDDGPTHHGLFDISYLRGIPNIMHMVPKDEDELADMMHTALAAQRPQRDPLSARHRDRRAGEGATYRPAYRQGGGDP